MVVCRCRKATNLYCFVHKVPVCGECICSSEHHICVVGTYSEWIIDGDYDWPPKCNICHEILQSEEAAVSRLGCLHVLHSSCFSKHLQSFPPHTAPAGYTCPVCLVPVWPPKNVKDYNCALSSELKNIISQSGLSKTLLGNDGLALQQPAPPPAFASASLVTFSTSNQAGVQLTDSVKSNIGLLGPLSDPKESKEDGVGTSNSGAVKEVNDIVDNANKAHSSLNMAALSKISSPITVHPGAMTRKYSGRVDKTGLNYAELDGEDEDEVRRKYSRRGPLQKQALKYLLPFSSNALPTLPVTTPSRKDDQNLLNAEEIIEGRHRRRPRSSGLNTKKILLVVAIMSCMATMLLLYYRLLQGAPSEDITQLNSNQGQP